MKKFLLILVALIALCSCTDDIWDSINALQGDVSTLQGEVSSIRGDIRVMTDNISEIQYDLEQGLSVVYVLDSIQIEMLEQQELDGRWLRDVSSNLDHLVEDVLPDTLYAYRILFANLIETSRNMLEAAQRNCEELRQLKDASDERYQEICDSISLGFVALRQLTDKAGYYTFIKDVCWSLDQAVSELSEQYEYHEHWLKDVSDAIVALDKNSDRINSIASRISVVEEQLEEINKNSDRINSIASRISVVEEQLEEINKKVVFSRTIEFDRSAMESTVVEYNKYGQLLYKRVESAKYNSKWEYFYTPGSSSFKEVIVRPGREYHVRDYYYSAYVSRRTYAVYLNEGKEEREYWTFRARNGFEICYFLYPDDSQTYVVNGFYASTSPEKLIFCQSVSESRSFAKIDFKGCGDISSITMQASQYAKLRSFIIELYDKYSTGETCISWYDFSCDWNEFVNGAGKDLCLPTIQ